MYLVLSLMLGFLVLSGVLSESSLRGIRVRRRLPRELYAGAENTIVLEISNQQQRVSAFAVVVVDHRAAGRDGASAESRSFALRIEAGATVRRPYRFQPEHRGYIEFTEFQVFTRFPFGLFSKSLTIPARETALVFPELEAIRVPQNFGGPRDSGERVSAPSGTGADAIGLRDYATGDSLRRIHWRASMRRRELLVREVESEHAAEIEVVLRTRGRTHGERFEQAVRWAASEIAALLDADTRVALRTDDDWIAADDGARHRARLLSHLALVEPSRGVPGDAR